MILGLFTRWFSGWALLIGWAMGMIVGTSLSWTGKAWAPVHTLVTVLSIIVGPFDPALASCV